MIQDVDELTMGTAQQAAEMLLAFWTRSHALEPPVLDACRQLARAVDPGGALADDAQADVEGIRMRVAVAVRAACQRDGGLQPIVRRLAQHGRRAGRFPLPQAYDQLEPHREVPRVARSASGTWPAGTITEGRTDTSAWTGKTVPDPFKHTDARQVEGILLAASEPTNLGRLRLGREEREIREALDLSPGRLHWTVRSSPALRLRDLTRALLETQPRIIHFAGHGSAQGLFFEDEIGRAQQVPPDALTDLFQVLQVPVDCVVLNACYAEAQARAISAHVPFVVGSPAKINDDAAVAFSIGFYQALGAGCNIRQAYGLGCVHMKGVGTGGLPLPVLIARDSR